MSRRLFAFSAIVSLFILALSGCSKPVPPQGGFEKPISIGLILPMKGNYATYGTLCKNSIDLAVDAVNNNGGISGRKLEILAGDDASNGNIAKSIAEQYVIVQKVSAIVGPYTSQSAMEAAPSVDKGGVPMVAIRASDPSITQVGKYIFRACYVSTYQGTILGCFAGHDLGLKRAAVIYNSSDPNSKTLIDNFKKEFAKFGGVLVSEKSYDMNTTDYTTQVSEVAKASPDVILLPDFEDKAGLIMKKASEMGVKATFLGTDLWDPANLVKVAGDAAVGSYFTAHFSPDDPDKKVQEFVSLYKDEYGTKPGESAALSYDAISLVIEAIKQANSDNPAKTREALANLKNFRGVTGMFSFDKDRNPKKGGTIMKVEPNAQVFVKHIKP